MRRSAARSAFALIPLLVLVIQTATGAAVRQAAPPPTPVPPDGSPSPFVSRLTTPADPLPAPHVEATNVLLADLGTGQVLLEKRSHDAVPVASLTKLMTAVVVVDAERGHLDRIFRVDPAAVFERGDYGGGSTLGLRGGERISIRGSLVGLLLGSANDAAEALAIEEAGSVAAFVDEMNAKAKELGMGQTRFASPHGLDDRGRSSAADLLILLRGVVDLPVLRDLIGDRFATIPSSTGPDRRIQNRNVMLWLYPGATGVKTGYTAGAGFCLIATARRGDRDLGVVILGGRDEVFSDAAALLNHGFAAYELRTLVEQAEPLGSVSVKGGEVPVVADRGLVALVRTADEGRIQRVISTSPSAAYPPVQGTVVGSIRFVVGGTSLGRVQLLAAELAVPREPPGPWWGRVGAAIASAIASAIGGLAG